MKKTKIEVSEFQLYLGKDFHRAEINHPLTRKVYTLLKTERYHNGKSIHGLTLRAIDDKKT